MVAEPPRVVDATASAPDLLALADKLDRLAGLFDTIGEQQRADLRRLQSLAGVRITEAERREVRVCIERLLDGERAVEISRSWWNDNRPALAELGARIGGTLAEFAADGFPATTPEEALEMRAALRRAERELRSTWREQFERRSRRRLAQVIRWVARLLRRSGG